MGWEKEMKKRTASKDNTSDGIGKTYLVHEDVTFIAGTYIPRMAVVFFIRRFINSGGLVFVPVCSGSNEFNEKSQRI